MSNFYFSLESESKGGPLDDFPHFFSTIFLVFFFTFSSPLHLCLGLFNRKTCFLYTQTRYITSANLIFSMFFVVVIIIYDVDVVFAKLSFSQLQVGSLILHFSNPPGRPPGQPESPHPILTYKLDFINLLRKRWIQKQQRTFFSPTESL